MKRTLLLIFLMGCLTMSGCLPEKPDHRVWKSKKEILKAIKDDSTIFYGTAFKNGLARIKYKDGYNYKKDRFNSDYYFINSKGETFDRYLSAFHPVDRIHASNLKIQKVDSVTFSILAKDGKMGVMNKLSAWVIPLKYDRIRFVASRYLLLTKNHKTGVATTWGKIIVPIKFDSVNIMNGNYFDVLKSGEWGVYSARQHQIVVPFEYQKFDYCYLCRPQPNYAYAKKHGKWGVVNFKDSVLIPFKFTHRLHHQLRSDNWVTGFKEDHQKVIINLHTKKVYSLAKYDRMKVVNSFLFLKSGDKIKMVDSKDDVLNEFGADKIEAALPAFYSTSFSFQSYFAIYNHGKVGIVDKAGKVIIPADEYDQIRVAGDYFIVKKGEKYGLLNQIGQLILPVKYADISILNHSNLKRKQTRDGVLFKISNGDARSFFNPESGIIVKPRFSYVALVLGADSSHFYVKIRKTHHPLNPRYRAIAGKVGLFSTEGEELIPPKFAAFYFLAPGLLKVFNGDNRGLYSLRKNKIVLPIKYERLQKLSSRFVAIGKPGNADADYIGVWDRKSGKIVSLPSNQVHLTGIDYLVRVKDTVNTYLYNLKKDKVIAQFKNHFYQAGDGGNYSISNFRHGLAKVYKDGKYGFINTEGKVVIPIKYDEVRMFPNGYIRLSTIVDHYGHAGLMAVYKDSYTDSTGQRITSKYYRRIDGDQHVPLATENYIFVTSIHKRVNENFYGVINLEGKEIIPPIYENIIPLPDHSGFRVFKHSQYGLLDAKGRLFVAPVLSYVRLDSRGSQGNGGFPKICALSRHQYFYLTKSGQILPFFIKFTGTNRTVNPIIDPRDRAVNPRNPIDKR